MKEKYILLKEKMKPMVLVLFECYFCLSILVTLIGRVTPVKQLIGSSIEGMLFNLLALLGGGFWLAYWLLRDNMVQKRYLVILYAFIAVMFLSSFLNRQYGLVDNLKTIIWTVIQFGVIFVYPKMLGKERVKKLFLRVWAFISCVWVLPVIYSFYQFLCGIGYWTEADPGRRIRQGWVQNRLFGIFNDPNYAAMTSVCIIILSLLFWQMRARKYERVLIAINVFIQGVYIRLSGSRSALVCLIAAITIGVCLLLVNRFVCNDERKNIWCVIFVPFLVAIIILGVNELNGAISIKAAEVYQKLTYVDKTVSENDTSSENVKGDTNPQETVDIDRQDTTVENISNNRTKIWKEYLRLFKGDYLLGGSPRNFMQKWAEKEPAGYLTTSKMETHNGYLSVLVGTGFVGFSCIVLFAVLYFRDLFKLAMSKETISREIVTSVMIMCVFAVFALFFTDLFFIHALSSIMFWFHCGMTMIWFRE